jgi:tight adherence protein B
MTTALLAALLVTLIAARSAGHLLHGSRAVRPRPRGRRQTTSPDYPGLLDAIARQVRSGASLAAAAVEEIDTASPLGEVVDRLSDGGSLADALAAIVPNDTDLALTVQALSATADLGGQIAATLDQAAAVLRERAAARAERRAHGAQARLSARVLTIVPLGFAGWSALTSRQTREVYTSSAAGAMCAVCGLALNLAGWRWMKRIVGGA